MQDERAPVVRRVLAAVVSLGLSAGIARLALSEDRHLMTTKDWAFLALLVAPFVVAAALIWSRRLGAQLLARACWWSFLLVGTLGLAITAGGGSGSARLQLMYGVLGCAFALLAVGRAGLDRDSDGFRPVAFRGTLLLSMLLAMADSGVLGLMSAGMLIGGHTHIKDLFVVPLCLLTCLGVVGLIRLRTWGLLVALATNVLIGTLAWNGAFGGSGPIRALFMSTALLQLAVPLPMLVTLVRRRVPAPDRWQRFRSV